MGMGVVHPAWELDAVSLSCLKTGIRFAIFLKL
jgi:hypothetical protein